MKIEWKTCFKICASVFALYLCIHFFPNFASLCSALFGAAAPLLIGCVVAYIVNILMSFYERHYFPRAKKRFLINGRRPVCMAAAFVTVIAVIVLVFVLIIPQLSACVQLLLAKLPDALKTLVTWIEALNILPEDIINFLLSIDWQSKISQIASTVTSGIGNVMNVVISAVSTVFSGVVTAFLSIIFAIYLLLGKDKICGQIKRVANRYVKKTWYDKAMHVLAAANDSFHKYIVGQCTEAVILGVLCALGMLILRLPYAAMIGALIAFTALIPVAGAYIGGGIGAFMIFTVSPIKAVVFVIFLVILQQFEGNVIYPRVVGSSMGLPAIWVLTAVTIGGGIMGIAGMLLGVPVAATAYRLLKEDINKVK
ncbi:MAG: AI-2E family transporter [Clostridia bacterium]|nr:AI-2E family transporter [Clostridia bacterium]